MMHRDSKSLLVHHEYSAGELARAIREVQIKIENYKLERRPSVPILGLGVTATCRETRHPATRLDADARPIAPGVAVRRDTISGRRSRWLKYAPSRSSVQGRRACVDFKFPLEIDDLGRSRGDTSLMGVVHIDGNGIGKKLQDWLRKRVEDGTSDDIVRKQYESVSRDLDRLSEIMFQELINRVVNAIEWDDRTGYVVRSSGHLQQTFSLGHRRAGDPGRMQVFLPIRPILLGGDDLTFVCDGRIALDLATAALTKFESSELDPIGQVGACAGVALVKPHTPFARAYDLAENLCTSAKLMLRDGNCTDRSALDWHIGLMSPTETLRSLRRRQYDGGKLTCRPYLLRKYDEHDESSWQWLTEEVLGTSKSGFRTSDPETGPNWNAHRGKLKMLREVVRKGESEVRNVINAWQVAHPRLALPEGMSNGFIGSRSPLLDAVELLDIHIALS